MPASLDGEGLVSTQTGEQQLEKKSITDVQLMVVRRATVNKAQTELVHAPEHEALHISQVESQQAKEGTLPEQHELVVGQSIVHKGIHLPGIHTPVTKPFPKAILDPPKVL